MHAMQLTGLDERDAGEDTVGDQTSVVAGLSTPRYFQSLRVCDGRRARRRKDAKVLETKCVS
jgi:hypothetical protein